MDPVPFLQLRVFLDSVDAALSILEELLGVLVVDLSSPDAVPRRRARARC